MTIEQRLADHIRQGDYNGYLATRYPEIGDGEDILFKGEDFSDTDMRPFPLDFNIFDHCILDGARMTGLPIFIRNSSAKGLNLVGSDAIIEAHNSDFRGMYYDESTSLARPWDGVGGCSHFYGCQFDPETREHFAKRGVIFKDSPAD